MLATSGSGGGGSIPNPGSEESHGSPRQGSNSLKQKHAKLAKMLNNSKLL